MDARDVIARALNAGIDRHGFTVTKSANKPLAYVHVGMEVTDAILAALHDAGFVVARLDDVAQTVWFYDHQWGDGVHERLSDLIGDYDPRSSGKDQL